MLLLIGLALFYTQSVFVLLLSIPMATNNQSAGYSSNQPCQSTNIALQLDSRPGVQLHFPTEVQLSH